MRKMTQQERIRFGLDGDYKDFAIGETMFIRDSNLEHATVLFWVDSDNDVYVQAKMGEDVLNWSFTRIQSAEAYRFAAFIELNISRWDILAALGGTPA